MIDLPSPYEDELQGTCYGLNESLVLVSGAGWPTVSDILLGTKAKTVAEGKLHVRYAIHYHALKDALIPQLVIDDHQKQHQGLKLIKFIFASGLAYPRADVIGKRVSGEDDHVFLRELDLARPLVATVQTPEQQAALPISIAVVIASLAKSNAEGWEPVTLDENILPPLLVEHTPCYKINPAHLDTLPGLLKEWEVRSRAAS